MAVAAPGRAGSPLPSPPPPFRITDFSHNRTARTVNATFLFEPCVEFLGEGMTAEGNALAIEAGNSIPIVVKSVQSRGIPPAALVAAEAVLGTGPEAGFGQSRREWRESEARRQRGILTDPGYRLPFRGCPELARLSPAGRGSMVSRLGAGRISSRSIRATRGAMTDIQ